MSTLETTTVAIPQAVKDDLSAAALLCSGSDTDPRAPAYRAAP
ncbi:hypothetical protein ACN6K4_003605 [Streptomyces hayashii]